MKIENLLNNLIVRIILGLSLVIPLTIISLVFGVHGLILGYSGIVDANLIFLLIGIITIVGFLGIIGSYWRIFRSSQIMSDKERRILIILLFCGITASIALCVWSLIFKEIIASLIFILLSTIGILFIYATPKKL